MDGPGGPPVRSTMLYYPGIRVESYAGYRGEEEPRRFEWMDDRIEIAEIIDRWLDPTHRYFKVRGADEGLYLLRHDADSGEWHLRVLWNAPERDREQT